LGTLLACSTDTDPERVLELPISRKKGADRRVVMSLGPDGPPYSSMPDLEGGDRIEVSGELELTTDAPEAGKACVRKPYRYEPKIDARLLLADEPQVTEPDREHAVPLGPILHETCEQRRHHTLVVFKDVSLTVPDRGLPWEGPSHLNLVVDAYHGDAEEGQVLLVGQNEPATASKPAHAEGNMGKLNVVRLRAAPAPTARRLMARESRNSHVPVLKERRTVIYSLRLVDLEEGEQLLMEAEVHIHNPHDYAARVSTEVVVGDSHLATDPTGRAAEVCPFRCQIGKFNGTNCLPGSTLTVRKVGTMRILESAHQPLFVNLAVTSSDPEGTPGPHDAVEVLPNGFLEVRRFGPEALHGPEGR
jgi:hypothetical protein